MRTRARACALAVASVLALAAVVGLAVSSKDAAAQEGTRAVPEGAATVAASPRPSDPGQFAKPGEDDDADPSPAAPPPDATAVAPSDHALLDRLIQEGGVDTQDAAHVSEYIERVRNAVLSALGFSLARMGLARPILWLIPRLVIVIVVVILGVLIYALAVSRQSPSLPVLMSPAISLDDETPRNLREEADRLLAQGALREALAALWRWLADELSAKGLGRTGPEVTRQEFVRSVRRTRPGWERLPELAALARTADILAYGTAGVTDAHVRALVPAAESLLR